MKFFDCNFGGLMARSLMKNLTRLARIHAITGQHGNWTHRDADLQVLSDIPFC